MRALPVLESLATAAHAALDDEARRALARRPALEPACAAGCSWCCHVHVDATVPEIVAVASYLERTLSREALAALRERLRAHATRVAPLSDVERWSQRVPCALLAADGRCSVYEARPLRCRAFHSCSAERCRDAFEGTSDAEPIACPPLVRATEAAEAAYERALIDAGLSAGCYRFELGLLVALDDPTAADRWRSDNDAFEPPG